MIQGHARNASAAGPLVPVGVRTVDTDADRPDTSSWLQRLAAPVAGRVPPWEIGFAVSALMLSLDAGPRLLMVGVGVLTGQAGALEARSIRDDPTIVNPLQGDQISQALWLGVYVVTVALLWARPRRPLTDALRELWPWAIVALALLSIFWSEVPSLTLRRSVGLLGTTLFGAYLVTRYRFSGFVRLLLVVAAVTAVLDLVTVLAIPTVGISTEEYVEGWRGAHSHKNGLGHVTAFSFVLWLLALRERQSPSLRLLAVCVLGICGLLLIFSNSVGGLMTLLALLALLPISALVRAPLPISLPSAAMVAILGVVALPWALGNVDIALGFLGRDPTLTGRLQLWDAVWQAIGRHPWLGYGYGAYWSGATGPAADVWSLTPGWSPKPPNAHNGLLELALNLGGLGVLLFGWSLAVNVVRAASILRRETTLTSMVPPVFLAYLMITGLPESRLVTQNSILWIVYVAVSIHLAITARGEHPAPARRQRDAVGRVPG